MRAAEASQRRPAVGPWITHSTAPIGSSRADLEPRVDLLPGPAIHPDLSSLAALSAPDEDGTAGTIQIALLESERLADPQTCAPKQHDECAQPLAVGILAGGSHDIDDLLDRRGISRVLLALVPWRPASVIARHSGRRAPVASGVQQHGFHESSLDGWVERAPLFEPTRRFHAARPSRTTACREMASEELRVVTIPDPDGREVVLLARIWTEKIARDHPELADHLDAVIQTVASPDHVEPDALTDRTRFYRRNVGPSRWLMAVVSYEQQPARIITALGQPEGSPAMEAVNIRIGPLEFDHADYDADGDVLYLHIGQPQPGEGEETPEGHVLRFAPGTQRIVGLTVINARAVLDRDGRLIVTVPETVEATAEDLAPALQAA